MESLLESNSFATTQSKSQAAVGGPQIDLTFHKYVGIVCKSTPPFLMTMFAKNGHRINESHRASMHTVSFSCNGHVCQKTTILKMIIVPFNHLLCARCFRNIRFKTIRKKLLLASNQNTTTRSPLLATPFRKEPICSDQTLAIHV